MQLKNPSFSIINSVLAIGGLVFLLATITSAQSNILNNGDKEQEKFEPLAEELRIKRLITLAQKEHQENLNRAQQLSALGAEIEMTFKQKNHLDRVGLKKLEKLEKLTRSIRSAAGGSDDECELEEIPSDLPAIVSKMTEKAAALKEEVEKTPRRVVSTTVIDQANVLLELIRRVRGLSART